MIIDSFNKNNIYSPSFDARVNLCDKAKLALPIKKELLAEHPILDFYCKENAFFLKIETLFDNFKSNVKHLQSRAGNTATTKKFLDKLIVMGIKTNTFLVQKIGSLFNEKSLENSFQKMQKLDKKSPEYIETLAKIGNSIKNKFIDINIEDGRIEKIAKSNRPTIFIMNHNAPPKDKFIYPIINSFLNYSYAVLGKQSSCPRPYIVVSKNVFNRANEKLCYLYNQMGMLPVDVNGGNGAANANARVFRSLIDKYIANEANIFIFPEGNNSIYKNKTLREKFQPGIVKTINKILEAKDSVDVVPIGITYNKEKNSMGAVYIGKTITLKHRQDNICSLIDDKIFDENIGEIGKNKTLKNIVELLVQKLSEAVDCSKKL